MTTVTGADGMTYTYEDTTLTITGTGTISSIARGVVSTLNASSLTTLIIGEGVTYLGGSDAFQGCHSLVNIKFPSTLTGVRAWTFYAITALRKVVFPASITEIGANSFGATALSEIYFMGNQPSSLNNNCLGGTSAVTIYSNGWADTVLTSGSSYMGTRTITYVHEVLNYYQHITYNGSKVQVDSAVRDKNGIQIDTGYQLKHTTATATLTTAGWSSNTQTVSVTGVTTTNTVLISPAPSSVDDYADSIIYCSAQGSGTLTFVCDTAPSSDVIVNVVILG